MLIYLLLVAFLALAFPAEAQPQLPEPNPAVSQGYPTSEGYLFIPSPVGNVLGFLGEGSNGLYYIAPDASGAGNALYRYQGDTKSILAEDSKLVGFPLPTSNSNLSKMLAIDPKSSEIAFGASSAFTPSMPIQITIDGVPAVQVYLGSGDGSWSPILQPLHQKVTMADGSSWIYEQTYSVGLSGGITTITAHLYDGKQLIWDTFAQYSGDEWSQVTGLVNIPHFTQVSERACRTGMAFSVPATPQGFGTEFWAIWRVGLNGSSPTSPSEIAPPRRIIEPAFQCNALGAGAPWVDTANANALNFAFLPINGGTEKVIFTGTAVGTESLSSSDWIRYLDDTTVLVATAVGGLVQLANGKGTVIKRSNEAPLGNGASVEFAEGRIVYGVHTLGGPMTTYMVYHPTLTQTAVSATAGQTVSLDGQDLVPALPDGSKPQPTLSCGGKDVPVFNLMFTVDAQTFVAGSNSCTLNVQGVQVPFTVALPTPATLPQVGSFTATPTAIQAGTTPLLTWTASGNPAPTISLNNGIGTVTGNSITVSPMSTTTYMLTAVNVAGSSTAQATITVGSSTPTRRPGGGIRRHRP